MRNDVVVTIEGRRDSVKGKGKLHAVVVEYFKYNSSISFGSLDY
jgi:hypothetical protein